MSDKYTIGGDTCDLIEQLKGEIAMAQAQNRSCRLPIRMLEEVIALLRYWKAGIEEIGKAKDGNWKGEFARELLQGVDVTRPD